MTARIRRSLTGTSAARRTRLMRGRSSAVAEPDASLRNPGQSGTLAELAFSGRRPDLAPAGFADGLALAVVELPGDLAVSRRV